MPFFTPLDDNEKRPGRIALGVEYDGTRYCGWQRLSHAPSVQEALEKALSKVASTPITVHCSGRTDSGVHAVRQVVHFDTPVGRSRKAWRMGGNVNLPPDIGIHWAVPVPDDFHARFSAIARRYRYMIINQPFRPVMERNNVTWCREPLNVADMQAAAAHLVGELDFSAFRAAGCQSRSPRRHVHFIEVSRHGHIVMIDIQANAFLHHMVRNIAGTLMAIGRGEKPVEWIVELMRGGDRTRSSATAAATGLHFVDVIYPPRYALPKEPLGPGLVAHLGEWTGERPLPDCPMVRSRMVRAEAEGAEEARAAGKLSEQEAIRLANVAREAERLSREHEQAIPAAGDPAAGDPAAGDPAAGAEDDTLTAATQNESSR
ncbi:tRNA pseudouridine(38-40) synthase TruA [Cobetia sp. 1CM21F]|uniref:tRNA pseudouridine(38-40) synthase TruA n=1 Tax=Cobetia sp. 1CM21F TaxID=2929163 RepID=UPI0032B78761